MTWTQAQPGAMLVRNIDGSAKSDPSLWLPSNRKLFIPARGQDHARPVVLLQGEDPLQTLALVFYQDRVLGRYQGQDETLLQI